MTLDLFIERNIQRFIQLADLAEQPPSAEMQWNDRGFQTFLTFRQGRMHISQCLLDPWRDDALLLLALQRAHPAWFAGIPQRVFTLRQGMVISCAPMADSVAEQWLWLHRRQRTFLEKLCKPT
ncbi:type III secretion system protein SsaM [Candidatus Symbiopectobacterium sp. NZEC135]|nr:type III secretion system protein SsaM [Candidatus Symbiopectobacterium sp. NZEC135]